MVMCSKSCEEGEKLRHSNWTSDEGHQYLGFLLLPCASLLYVQSLACLQTSFSCLPRGASPPASLPSTVGKPPSHEGWFEKLHSSVLQYKSTVPSREVDFLPIRLPCRWQASEDAEQLDPEWAALFTNQINPARSASAQLQRFCSTAIYLTADYG